MEWFNQVALGAPLWMWGSFLLVVLLLVSFDLGILHKKDEEISVSQSLRLSAFYIFAGLLFGLWVWHIKGGTSAMDYYTGFLIEKSLSLDNIFVISLIFSYFAIPRAYQHRVLFWGIIGVIVLRGIMIGVGAAVVKEYEWTLYLFAAFLIFTGFKMMLPEKEEAKDFADNAVLRFLKKHMRVTKDLHEQQFFVKQTDKDGGLKWFATPLFLALCMVEISDVIFAVDSVPAIFSITKDPFIVYTSNIFAILGLRALYFALAAVLARFHYLKYALAAVLVFIGSKVFLGDFVFGGKVPAVLSLSVTFGLLAAGVLYSMYKTRGQATQEASQLQ
ncbi:TerC family protein [Massilia sp. W12]|uniref:TerC family protein n=1 Tax=Massilia sp. W12 TaxID=3126507 RepID=UPI0030CD0720